MLITTATLMILPTTLTATYNNNSNNHNFDNVATNETGSRSLCMRPSSDPPNFGPIERGENQTNGAD